MIHVYYTENYEVGDGDRLDIKWWLIMPETVPLSAIVYGDLRINETEDKCMEFMRRGLLIYEKYVEIDCGLEINIPGQSRQELRLIFEDIDGWLAGLNDDDERDKLKRIYNIFEECMGELHYLLNQLFTRFKLSALFEKLELNVIK